MRLFLIDYENVNSAGLQGIGQLDPQDRIILFYSQAANTLSFEIMDEMLAANIIPERVCIAQSGKNALDFQLVTFLGYLIAKNKADAYYIISKDTGYSAAVTFARDYLNTKVAIKPSIQAVLRSATPTAKPKKDKKKAPISLRKRATVVQVQVQPIVNVADATAAMAVSAISADMVRDLLPDTVTDEMAHQIFNCLSDSHSKTEFHNALQQSFSNEDSKLYYHCLKPSFATAFTD
ncbi:MAG: PIN domain-containing protein [Oscillospiraceae bacterium]|nr:PIN domain-containing protein [Oscillospiraceae bacterium]